MKGLTKTLFKLEVAGFSVTSLAVAGFYLASSIRTSPINWGFFLAIQFFYLFVLAGATTLCLAIAGLLLGALEKSETNEEARRRLTRASSAILVTGALGGLMYSLLWS